MRWAISYKGWQSSIKLSHSEKVQGVNSLLKDGRHMLMWDFDNITREEVQNELLHIQSLFGLPDIYLLFSGRENCWHAYCFRAMPWADVVSLLAHTKGICPMFFKVGVVRGYFTLRFSQKGRVPIKEATLLASDALPDVDPSDMVYGDEYWTKRL